MGRYPRGGRPLRATLVPLASASALLAAVVPAQAVTARPNLVVTSTSTTAVRVAIGAGFAVTDTTKNAGATRANPSTTRYYLSKDTLKNPTDQPLAGSRAVPALAPGRSSRGTVTIKVPITTRIGGYFVLACADDRHTLTESSERDNCRATRSMITVVKGRPDLVVTAVGDPPATVEGGASFDSTDTTKNAGSGDAKASTTAFYLSADALKSADDSQVGQRAVGPLPGRTSSSGSTPLTAAGVPDGSYFLLACADALKAVVESKEANNCRAATGKVRIAPPPPGAIDPGSSTSMYDASAFLWAGNDPVQEGVAAGTIDLGRVVVVRGLVVNAHTGDPLDDVTVTVLDHPEYGVTHTHDGGRYDMALNGGTQVTLELEHSGFLSVQKTVDTPWQDYVQVDPVAMVHLDANVTLVDLSSNADFQVVRGSTETDEDGTRRATLLVPKGKIGRASCRERV